MASTLQGKSVFESKKGTTGKKLSEFLMQMKSANITDVPARRTAVLRGLAVLLGEDTTDFFQTCFDIDIVAPQVSIGILTVVPEDSPMSPQGLPLEELSAQSRGGLLVVVSLTSVVC
ncbi:unnamed protein product [Leuciscus chuanchicus]